MYFQYAEFFDSIGQETYTERTKFFFKCNLLPFANDKIRLFLKIPDVHGVAKGQFSNDAVGASGKKSLNETEKI